jgi:hypothetical protein
MRGKASVFEWEERRGSDSEREEEAAKTDLDLLQLALDLLPLRPLPLRFLSLSLSSLPQSLHFLLRLLNLLQCFLQVLLQLRNLGASTLSRCDDSVELGAGAGEVGAEGGDGLFGLREGGEEELAGGGEGGETLEGSRERFL